jgi:hypothetical protein
VQMMLVKKNMVGFFFSKIIMELKDFQASEGPHHLSMRPFYFKRKAKNLTHRSNYFTGHVKLVNFSLKLLILYQQNKKTHQPKA